MLFDSMAKRFFGFSDVFSSTFVALYLVTRSEICPQCSLPWNGNMSQYIEVDLRVVRFHQFLQSDSEGFCFFVNKRSDAETSFAFNYFGQLFRHVFHLFLHDIFLYFGFYDCVWVFVLFENTSNVFNFNLSIGLSAANLPNTIQ